jgi:cell division protein FtsW
MLVLSFTNGRFCFYSFALDRGMTELYFFNNQLLYMTIGLVIASIPYYLTCPYEHIRPKPNLCYSVLRVVLLVATLFSTPINGSKRWLNLGVF